MLIGYDPVAKELILDSGSGLPPLSVHQPALIVKLYLDDGLFVVSMEGERLALHFHPVEEGADASLIEEMRHLWRVSSKPGCQGHTD